MFALFILSFLIIIMMLGLQIAERRLGRPILSHARIARTEQKIERGVKATATLIVEGVAQGARRSKELVHSGSTRTFKEYRGKFLEKAKVMVRLVEGKKALPKRRRISAYLKRVSSYRDSAAVETEE